MSCRRSWLQSVSDRRLPTVGVCGPVRGERIQTQWTLITASFFLKHKILQLLQPSFADVVPIMGLLGDDVKLTA